MIRVVVHERLELGAVAGDVHVVWFGCLDLGADGGRVRHRADGGGQVAGHRGVLPGLGADAVSPPGDVGRGLAVFRVAGPAPPVPLGFRLGMVRQQPLMEGVIQRAAVVEIAHDPASGSASPAAARAEVRGLAVQAASSWSTRATTSGVTW